MPARSPADPLPVPAQRCSPVVRPGLRRDELLIYLRVNPLVVVLRVRARKNACDGEGAGQNSRRVNIRRALRQPVEPMADTGGHRSSRAAGVVSRTV
eukprot:356225-Chlamydomonas_euryale.AAC.7